MAQRHPYTHIGIIDMPPTLKPLLWLGSSKPDLMELPRPVQRTFGYALYLAQAGGKHEQAKPLHGFGSAGVLEIVEDWRGNANGPSTQCVSTKPFVCSTSSKRRRPAAAKRRSRTWT